MCLGIVGQVVEMSKQHPELAMVDVAGAPREINIMMLSDEGLQCGDWILIHAGFAMQKIDETTAREQMAALREYTGGPPQGDEVEEQ
jgi:hydrogenase expression/formation protein HypC